MLVNGAEIHRVEDTIGRILSAYGAEGEEIFATPDSIVVSVNEDGDRPITKSKRVYSRDTNLTKLDRLNSLSRKICASKPSSEEMYAELNSILALKSYPIYLDILAFLAIGFSYSLFFGGSVSDAVCAAFIAGFIRVIQIPLKKHRVNTFFMCILCSTFAAAASSLCVAGGLASSVDKTLVGALMTLVPGVVITNCMRDFIAEDFMSGLFGLVEALLTATGIAVGVALAFAFGGVVL